MPKLLNAINWCGRAFDAQTSQARPPIILLGPPRSNSTLIHRLLAHHTEVVAPSLKELVFPGMTGAMFRAALSTIPQSTVDRMYPPQIHGTGANAPEADDIALMSAYSEGLFGWAYGAALRGACQPVLDAGKHLDYLDWLRGYVATKHPSKTVCSKYFAGVHHFEALQAQNPNARFVLLLRDPKSVCQSLSTLLESALRSRRTRIHNPDEYWNNIYTYIVRTYERIEVVADRDDPGVMTLWDADVKADLGASIAAVCRHAGLPATGNDALAQKVAEKSSGGPYRRRYEYSNALQVIFKTDDFAAYYRRQAGRAATYPRTPTLIDETKAR